MAKKQAFEEGEVKRRLAGWGVEAIRGINVRRQRCIRSDRG
jgi:hypothetical protein